MRNSSQTILAINPGTRYLGMAVFRGNQLKDWRIKILKGRWSREKLKKALTIISTWIERYQPDLLVIKRLHPSRSSRGLNSLQTQIQRVCLRKNVTLTQHSIKYLETVFCQEERRNKRSLAEAVAADYPELYFELNIEKLRKNSYHMRMFEAVALGAVGTNEIDNQLNGQSDLFRSLSAPKQNGKKQGKNPGH
jgi:Holliday junction resolvasome RuvABC endonuclease subunit